VEGEVGSSEWRERKSVNTTSRTNIRSVFSIQWTVRFDETNQKRGTMSRLTTKDGTQTNFNTGEQDIPSSSATAGRSARTLLKCAWKTEKAMVNKPPQRAANSWTTRRDEKRRRIESVRSWMQGPILSQEKIVDEIGAQPSSYGSGSRRSGIPTKQACEA